MILFKNETICFSSSSLINILLSLQFLFSLYIGLNLHLLWLKWVLRESQRVRVLTDGARHLIERKQRIKENYIITQLAHGLQLVI